MNDRRGRFARVAVLGIAAVLVVACGSTVPLGESAAGTNTSGLGGGLGTAGTNTGPPSGIGLNGPTGASRPLGGSGAGVGASGTTGSVLPRVSTRVTTPLALGVFDAVSPNDFFKTFGADLEASVTTQQAAKAMIAYYNRHGGIAGRRIRMVEYNHDPFETSSDTYYEAACAKFTQDNHVDVAISLSGDVLSDNYEACLAKAGTVNIEARAAGATDYQGYAQFPTMFSVGMVSWNRKLDAVLTGLARHGFLSRKNKIGVIVENCNYDVRAYAATFQPLARRFGFTVMRRDIDCLTGLRDVGKFESQVAAAVLPFQTANVDRVTFVSSFEGLALLAFTNQADQQGYTPWYALSGSAWVGTNASTYSSKSLPRMVGMGNIPDLDLTSQMRASSATTRCRSIMASQGVRPSNKLDESYLDLTCAAFFLLEMGLAKSNGHSDRSTLVSAVESLGASYVSPIILGGDTQYGPTTHDGGATLFSIFGYKTSCSCFVYKTKPARLA